MSLFRKVDTRTSLFLKKFSLIGKMIEEMEGKCLHFYKFFSFYLFLWCIWWFIFTRLSNYWNKWLAPLGYSPLMWGTFLTGKYLIGSSEKVKESVLSGSSFSYLKMLYFFCTRKYLVGSKKVEERVLSDSEYSFGKYGCDCVNLGCLCKSPAYYINFYKIKKVCPSYSQYSRMTA